MTTFIKSSWESDVTPNLRIARKRTSAVSYQTYTIVAGGKGADGNDLTSIEILDITTQQWTLLLSVCLPQPMYCPGLAVCGESLIIVGYECENAVRSNMASIIPISDIINNLTSTTLTTKSINWSSLPKPPFWRGTLVPNCSPPIIIGGDDIQDYVYNDVTLYDDTEKVWKKVSPLPFSCAYPTVMKIYDTTVIVAGGCTDVFRVQSATASTLSRVVIGHLERTK